LRTTLVTRTTLVCYTLSLYCPIASTCSCINQALQRQAQAEIDELARVLMNPSSAILTATSGTPSIVGGTVPSLPDLPCGGSSGSGGGNLGSSTLAASFSGWGCEAQVEGSADGDDTHQFFALVGLGSTNNDTIADADAGRSVTGLRRRRSQRLAGVAPADHSGGGGASAPQPHNVHKHVHSIHGPATLLKRLMTPEGRCDIFPGIGTRCLHEFGSLPSPSIGGCAVIVFECRRITCGFQSGEVSILTATTHRSNSDHTSLPIITLIVRRIGLHTPMMGSERVEPQAPCNSAHFFDAVFAASRTAGVSFQLPHSCLRELLPLFLPHHGSSARGARWFDASLTREVNAKMDFWILWQYLK
jgi:hypothetical protein